MDNFKNEIINGIHCSRYIASWCTAGGELHGSKRRDGEFIDWLKNLFINGRFLTDEEVTFIHQFASNGKLELEINAKEFLKGA